MSLPNVRELVCALLISAFLLVIDLSTFHLFPTPWPDDISFSEPAINLATRGALDTFVWPAQPSGTFWTANTPLYPLILSGWIEVAGFSLFAIRSFNYLLISIACIGVWMLALRFGICRSMWARLSLIPMIHLGYGVSFAYRSSRPDILGLLILLLYVYSLTITRTTRRRTLCTACAIAAVWTGPQLGILIGAGALLALTLGWIARTDVVATIIGGSLGAVSFFLTLLAFDAVPNFMASVALGRTGGIGIEIPVLMKLRKCLVAYVSDYSFVPIFSAAVCLAAAGWPAFDRQVRKQLVFLASWISMIPWLLNFTSNYGYYYSYMLHVPACWSLVLVFDRVRFATRRPKALVGAFIGAILVGTAVGLPLRLAIALHEVDFMPRAAIATTLQNHLRATDTVLSDNATFFEVKAIAPLVFGEYYHRLGGMNVSEKASLTALVLYPKDFESVSSSVGGEWEAVGDTFGDVRLPDAGSTPPMLTKLLDRYFSSPQMIRAPLQVYRRTVR
ncbi:MAG: hypothetical protein V4819_21815 [Verrucomicrobiota bacterium]